MVLTPLFKLMSEKHASDMFFTAGSPIQIKIQGEMMPINGQVLELAASRERLRMHDRRADRHFERNWRAIFR